MKKNDSTKSRQKIHIILGTKAQLIKMAPIMRELKINNISYRFIFTGQHKETITDLIKDFDIRPPDIILHKGKDITSIFQMLTWTLKLTLKSIFKRKLIFGVDYNRNDIVLTHGDTSSTVLGAIMGKLAKMKVGHVESGLRSYKIFDPFPEELNRLITFRLSDIYYCPGDFAYNNLEKYSGKKINTKQNTLYDSLKHSLRKNSSKISIPPKEYCVCSVHRYENIFNKKQLLRIINLLEIISENIKVLFIMHLPTKKQLKKFNLYKRLSNNPNIELRPRYNYSDFINLLSKSTYLISDGGSNQEETYYLGLPCLLLRDRSERQEGLNTNVVISNYNVKIVKDFINNYANRKHDRLKLDTSPSSIIVDHLMKYYE